MKHTLCFITILLGSLLDLYANNENDSLLKVLDKVISERLVYTEKKEATIKELKAKKKEQKDLGRYVSSEFRDSPSIRNVCLRFCGTVH